MAVPYIPLSAYMRGGTSVGGELEGELDVPGSPGFLYKLGRLLDTPGRWVRSGLTGMEDATGRDVLYKLGLYKSRHNPAGLDMSDIAGFGAEVVADPLTYLAGVGQLTKGGKLASQVAKGGERLASFGSFARSAETPIRKAASLAKFAEEKANIIKRVRELNRMKAPLKLAKGWGAQGAKGVEQRALLSFGVPFTSPRLNIYAPGVLARLEKVAPLLRKIPGSSTLEKVFNVEARHDPRTKALREVHAWEERSRQMDVLEKLTGLKKLQEPLDADWAANKRPLTEGIEYNQIPARSQQQQAQLLQDLTQKHSDIRDIFQRGWAGKQKKKAETYLGRETAKARTMEEIASALEKSGVDERLRRVHADFGDELEQTFGDFSKRIQDIQLKRALERSEGYIRQAGEVSKLEPDVQISKTLQDMRQGIDRARELFKASLDVAVYTKGKDAEYSRRLLRMGRARLLRATKEGVGQAIKEARAAAAKGSPRAAELEALALKLWNDAQGWITQQAKRIDDLGKTKAASQDLLAYKAANAGPAARAAARKRKQAQETITRALAEAYKIESRPMSQRQKDRLLIALAKATGRYTKQDLAAQQAAQEAMAGLGRVPQGGMPYIQRAEDLYRGEREAEVLANVAEPDSYLRAKTKGYTFRTPGPGQQAYIEEFPGAAKAPETRVLQIAGPHTKMRREELLEMTTPEASDKLAELAGMKPEAGAWFEDDPTKVLGKRLTLGQQNIAASQYAKAVVEQFARPHAPGMMSADEFIKQAGLVGVRAPDGMGIPMRIADEFLALKEIYSKPEAAKKISKALDFINGLFRAGLTQPFPAFHIRNLISDTMLSALGAGADLKQIIPALRLFKNPAWKRKMEELGASRGQKVRELVKDIKPGAGNPMMDALYSKIPGFKTVTQKLEPLTTAVEDFTRTWHFLSKKAKGMTDFEAAAEVRKWLLDYSSMTDIEKEYLRKWVLFYQWPRKVIPLLAKSSVEVPNRFAGLVRGTTWPSVERPKEGLPEYLRQSAAIPISPNAQGDPRFVTGFGSPLEELNKLDLSSPAGGVFGGLGTLARKIGGQLAPTLKVPLETMSGKEFYYDRPIILGDKAPEALLFPGLKQLFGAERIDLGGGKSRVRADPYMLYYLQRNMPWARAVQTAGQMADVIKDVDPRTSRGMNLLKLITGIRVPSLDTEDIARTEIETIKGKIQGLIREGRAGEKPIFFARSKDGVKDPEVQALLKRSRNIQKLLKNAREQEQPAPP